MTETAGDNSVYEVVIPNTAEAGQEAQQQLMDRLSENNWDEKVLFGIKLALEEALVNAIKHGNRNDPSKRITFQYRVSPERLHIVIEDEGEGFNPDDVPDPTLPENLEKPCGRGLMLMRVYMTSVEFDGRGNRVVMVKDNDEEGEDE